MSSSSDINSFAECTGTVPEYPPSQTIYPYLPSLGANALFLAHFALATIIQLAVGIKWRTWTFMLALVLSCNCEFIGYIGLITLHNAPWEQTGFKIQIICLVIAPAFIVLGIYPSLKHFSLTFGADFPLLKPGLSPESSSAPIFCPWSCKEPAMSSLSTHRPLLSSEIEETSPSPASCVMSLHSSSSTHRPCNTSCASESIAPPSAPNPLIIIRSLRLRVYCAAIFVTYITILTPMYVPHFQADG